MLGYGLSGLDHAVTAGDGLLFLVMLVVGAITIYCFWLVIATLAFWIVNVWSIMELFDGLYQTGRFPVSIYPIWLRLGVTFLIPIAFAITVPAEAATGRLDWPTVALAGGFCVALFALHALVVGLRLAPLLRRVGVARRARRRTCPTPRGARSRSRRP